MLELADKLEPGWTRFRGTLLLDLQSAMTMQTKREFEAEKLTKAGAQVILIRVKSNLRAEKLRCDTVWITTIASPKN